jgi:hypothetical protein
MEQYQDLFALMIGTIVIGVVMSKTRYWLLRAVLGTVIAGSFCLWVVIAFSNFDYAFGYEHHPLAAFEYIAKVRFCAALVAVLFLGVQVAKWLDRHWPRRRTGQRIPH